MNTLQTVCPIDILLVEDNPGDVRLTMEALKDAKMINRLHVVENGVDALDFLYQRGAYQQAPRPDLILLDLNLPKKNGREVLAEIKGDESLKTIPVVILTTSKAEEDILKAYDLHANCYISKPVDFLQFTNVVRTIETFWLTIVMLPPKSTCSMQPPPRNEQVT
ncbi:MAG TPA: response regulator [Noviherbaspirillum sp.]|nr:response regulator [Noviherbaspirillum sp.]